MSKENDNFEAQITFTKHTPYRVRGIKSITDSDGEEIELGAVTGLCRCGSSERKPFCDGTHKEIGIKGEKEADRRHDKVKSYPGKMITIHDNRGVCSHAEECIKSLPVVFRKEEKPWIDPDASGIEETIKTINKCPSGALSYTINDIHYESEANEPRIVAAKDGPFEISGGVLLKDDEGSKPLNKDKYVLCRCNESKNKPFCDGSHHNVGFIA